MVNSVGVSKLASTDLIFIDLGVKVNGAYYRNVLLSAEFMFQQDCSAPAHRARDTATSRASK